MDIFQESPLPLNLKKYPVEMVGQNWLPDTHFKTKAGDSQSKIKVKGEQSSKSKVKLYSL